MSVAQAPVAVTIHCVFPINFISDYERTRNKYRKKLPHNVLISCTFVSYMLQFFLLISFFFFFILYVIQFEQKKVLQLFRHEQKNATDIEKNKRIKSFYGSR